MVQLAHVTETIEAPKAAIWELLTDFAHPQRLAATIDRCTMQGRGVGAVRIVESSRGLVIHERLLEQDFARGRFRYEVLDSGDMPFAHVTRYECAVTLSARPDGATEIDWSSTGDVDGPVEPVTHYLSDLYRRATDNIRREVVGT